MSQPIPSIAAGLRSLVTRVEEAVIANTALDWGSMPKKVYFIQGHPLEIVNVLLSLTKGPTTKNKKYPLVALFRDFREDVSEGAHGYTVSARPRLLICTLTQPNFRADEREAKNFIPILQPIFEELVGQIRLSAAFGAPTVKDMGIVKWDRYYWGTQVADANVLNDYIDAIEIEGINLKLINNLICPPTLAGQ